MAKPKQAVKSANPTAPAPAVNASPATIRKRDPPALPLQHYLSRAPIQLAALYFTALQAARVANPTTKETTLANFITTLALYPHETLGVVVAGATVIQIWMGWWIRGHRREALGLSPKPGAKSLKPKRGFTATLKDMTMNAVNGKAPIKPTRTPASTSKGDNPDVFGPAALILTGATALIYVGAVLLGAPITSYMGETFLLSSLIAVLALAPTAIAVPHTEHYVWLRLFSSVSPANDLELALVAPALGTVIGCWLGVIPIPLDWGRPWQAWPTTCVLGALGGNAIGTVVGVVWCTWNAMKRNQAESLAAEKQKAA